MNNNLIIDNKPWHIQKIITYLAIITIGIINIIPSVLNHKEREKQRKLYEAIIKEQKKQIKLLKSKLDDGEKNEKPWFTKNKLL